jgi:probable addiction module antidote protein
METTTTPYDVAEHLRTHEEMAAYLEACIEEADGDAAFIAQALGDIARAQGMTQVARDSAFPEKASTRPCQESEARALTPFSRLSQRLV